ncbi:MULTISPECIES: permease-like cell division protein FtsX [unclassified Paenibacillus]|uniref:permease-like cell division protein FtsX n=1 Tax=unclassified Paenibacillus TaxID=185978 RepID=UPI001C1154FF|nr:MULTISPECIES: permease-like cell division protein FtsX [unclassified Paenibacillus]MBU5442267.1 permease-like cell division protein FtsX [Paenibacillus sp. MSJ-34]CAH0121820.1 Cell division protein FtsX [Paenibacillus sp. CECT 9249]
MTFNTFTRHIREGSKNVIRNGWMSFASISSIVISLFILGVFVILALNVNALSDQIESKVQIQVYLQNVSTEKIQALKTEIGNIPEVSKIDYISKMRGMELFRESLGEDGADLLDGYNEENNPLPDSFLVEVYEPTTVPLVAKKINGINKVDTAEPIMKVKYGEGTVEKLFAVTNTIRNIGLIIVAGLAVTAMFLISNTIKVTILARRREIGIMKLVGATNHFIRWPFFVEGALIGLIGSLITIGLLFLGYYRLVDSTQNQLGLMLIKLVPLQDMWMQVGLLMLCLGVLIGIWGSTISIRKFLKV